MFSFADLSAVFLTPARFTRKQGSQTHIGLTGNPTRILFDLDLSILIALFTVGGFQGTMKVLFEPSKRYMREDKALRRILRFRFMTGFASYSMLIQFLLSHEPIDLG